MKLELGSGPRPTPGYLHSDVCDFDDIDFIASPENIQLSSNSLDEVLALGVVEHLTFTQSHLTFLNVARMLRTNGEFVFDCPDLLAWCSYYVQMRNGKEVPFTEEHILSTIYGWQRWPGDEHKSGWSEKSITTALNRTGFHKITFGVDQMLERGHDRRRFHRPEDAHFYIVAVKN